MSERQAAERGETEAGSAAVPSGPRQWVITAGEYPYQYGCRIVAGPDLPNAESVTVEEVGPVSEAQVEAGARALVTARGVRGLFESGAQRELAALAVLSAAREVKSEFGRGLLRDTELLVVRSDVQSVIDRMKLDVQRPELRSPARDEDYRATLERAVARLGGEVKGDG